MDSLRHGIGIRLSLIIGVIFSLYLAVVLALGYVMYQQYQGFSELASGQFGRAMAAAELTRDAEIIAAEVFEIMVGSTRSVSAGNQRTENLANLYRMARERLEQLNVSAGHDAAIRNELDRLQAPFFASLDRLGHQLDREQLLQSSYLQRFDELFLLLQQLPVNDPGSLETEEQLFLSHALVALTSAASAMTAERPGHLAKLEAQCRRSLQRLDALSLGGTQWIELKGRLNRVLPEIFANRPQMLQHARATLATARNTRLLAQKMTGATYSYHLQLKASAQDAIAGHQQLIRRSLLGLLLASLALGAVTVWALLYIRRHIVKRINQLSHAMQAHLQGDAVPIPREGQDEISAMGNSFSVFVDARCQAERQLEEANEHLRQVNQELEQLSVTDALTGVANRRSFDQQFAVEWQRALRDQRTLAVIMADVDLFKRFNDAFGHQKGDVCLQQVAQTMAAQLKRGGDLIARYGGEEFILLLPGLTLEQAAQLAEQIRSAVWSLNIPHHTPSGRVTISLGVASAIPSREDRMESLIRDADSALYQAKEQGRDRVSLWPAPQ